MKLILVLVVALLAACGSDTGDEIANVCAKEIGAPCPDPWAPTPDHYMAPTK